MRSAVQRVLVVLVIGSFLGIPHGDATVKGKTVSNASIGRDGLIHILRTDGTEFIAPREMSPVTLADSDNMQVSVEVPIVAEDHRTVGWLVNFPNCCTSYPIPLVLVIYKDGKILSRIRPGVELPIWKWVFIAGGSRVAYYSETVHGGLGRRCELRDIATGKLLEEWHPGKSNPLPKWAEPFAQDLGNLKDSGLN